MPNTKTTNNAEQPQRIAFSGKGNGKKGGKRFMPHVRNIDKNKCIKASTVYRTVRGVANSVNYETKQGNVKTKELPRVRAVEKKAITLLQCENSLFMAHLINQGYILAQNARRKTLKKEDIIYAWKSVQTDNPVGDVILEKDNKSAA